MSIEENLKQELSNKFPFLEGKVVVQRERRILVDVSYGHFREVFDFIIKTMDINMLSALTGLDEGQELSFIYHLARDNGIVLNLKTSVPKENPVIKTVGDIFPSADIYERELVDLLGAKVEGMGSGPRYPLTDDWPAGEYPLRKDWRPKNA